jgi:hypothetical protein
VSGSSCGLGGIVVRGPAVGPFAGFVVEPDGFAVLVGALVPVGVVLVLGVDSAVRAVTGFGRHDLEGEVVTVGIGTGDHGVVHRVERILTTQRAADPSAAP